MNVNLLVKDEKEQPVATADAYLYTSQKAFDIAYNKSLKGIYDGTGSFLQGKVLNGQLVFSEIPSNQPYWILVHDESRNFQGPDVPDSIKIHRDNTGANYYIDQFQNGTEISAKIKLEAVNALIKIESTSGTTTFPIMDIGNKYDTSSITLSPYVQVRKGSVPYMVRDNICIWTGAVEAEGGVVTTETLGACDNAAITFTYAGNYTTNSFIRIYLGQNKSAPIAVLDNTKKSVTIYVGTAADYTYFAEMVDGRKCVWEDSIKIITGQTTNITLDACN